ncbi:uncharacterized protein LOC128226686 [Mya arenaria]|uniref:uncharacterized protein LOC128226686 n=1 Tax=Mya arenaria TaxID=6604 RepID=UPI0022E30865|nr:uncharacterized protein LOC128226686 [Mya arenaria]
MAKRLKLKMGGFESGGKRRKKHAEISQYLSDSESSGNDGLAASHDSVENIDISDDEMTENDKVHASCDSSENSGTSDEESSGNDELPTSHDSAENSDIRDDERIGYDKVHSSYDSFEYSDEGDEESSGNDGLAASHFSVENIDISDDERTGNDKEHGSYDSSENNGTSDEESSGNDELQTTNDSFENSDESDEEEPETSNEVDKLGQTNPSRITLKKEMALYKVNNDRVDGLNSVDEGTVKDIEECIIRELEKGQNLEKKDIKRNDCSPFKIAWFYYKTEKTINIQASQIATDREASNAQRLPGDRKTGNILIYYRFFNGTPEVYLLCDGAAFNAILHLVDNDFRTKFAKCFLDDQCIKEIETINIAGPHTQVKNTFKMGTKNALNTALYFEKVIISLIGILKEDCGLHKIVNDPVDSGKKINLKIGLNTVRICVKMSCEMWSKVIEHISNKVSKPAPETIISNVLDFVRQVSDKCQRQELSSNMSKKAVDLILEKEQYDDFYLSHRYTRDFLLSSDVRLLMKKSGPGDDKVVQLWQSVPSLQEVINVLREGFDSRDLENGLNDRKIILTYWNQNGKLVSEAVQNYIHGSIQVEDELFYKIGSKWYQLSTHFSQTVDNTFTNFTKRCTFLKAEEARMVDVLKYPWKHSDKQFDIKDVISVLGIKEKKAKLLVKILLDSRISIASENGEMSFTHSSFLFPESSDVARAIKTGSVDQKSNSSSSTTKEKKNSPSYVIWSCKQGRISLNKLPNTTIEKERRIVCNVKKGKKMYQVVNPVLTKALHHKIQRKIPGVMEYEITNFLRSMMPLNENEYNQLYLHNTHRTEEFIVFPGDRLQANNVELFDILLHDKKRRQTFLIHNKNGLGNTTRDACAQIRDSAELLWHDFTRGLQTHIKKLWDDGTNSATALSPYREQLKEKLLRIGKNEYLRIFAKNVQFVFVFAFVTSTKTDHNLKFDFKAMSRKDFESREFADGAGVLHELQDKKLVSSDGYLTDKFLGITNLEKFLNECRKLNIFKDKTQKRKKAIYRILTKMGKCNVSTIAKLELLALDSDFAKYQIGGWRKFKLRILQLKSS